MTLAANALQKAVYARLTASLGGVAVYDHAPQNAAFPYVLIGDDTAVTWDTKTRDGQEYTLTIHCWDAPKAGRKSVKAVAAQIYAALHRQEDSIPVTGYRLVLLIWEFMDTFQEPAEGDADRYYHGVLRFRALVQDA